MVLSRRRCGPRPEFGFIKARPKCGTRPEWNLQVAMGCRRRLRCRTPGLSCGEARRSCQCISGESRFWALLWGHTEFIKAQLEMLTAEHQTLFHRIPLIEDVQSAWSILVHRAAARANYVASVVELLTARQFCERHDIGLWRCLCAVVQISPDQPEDVVEAASLPMVLGGVGLRSAVRVSEPAYWASWMDTVPVIRKRHLEIAERLVAEFERGPHRSCVPQLMHNEASREPWGLNLPAGRLRHWEHVRCQEEPDDFEPYCVRQGWQHEASSRVERKL